MGKFLSNWNYRGSCLYIPEGEFDSQAGGPLPEFVNLVLTFRILFFNSSGDQEFSSPVGGKEAALWQMSIPIAVRSIEKYEHKTVSAASKKGFKCIFPVVPVSTSIYITSSKSNAIPCSGSTLWQNLKRSQKALCEDSPPTAPPVLLF